ncbi:MAG: hypothetical protein ACREUP_04230 [Burkholderiales bacterium]
MSEAGVPGYESSGWYGLWSTAGTPQAVMDLLNRETARILDSSTLKEQFGTQGLQPIPTSPQAFGIRLREEIRKWRPVVKASGARPE